jgi:nucleoside phosphorylase
MAFVVPRGAEEAAVRRAVPDARIIPIAAGSRATAADALMPGETAIVVGLCGALRAHRVGETVIYRELADDVGRISTDAAALKTVRARLPGAALVAAATADHVVTRAAERLALAEHFAADVVDMEGTHLARAFAERGIPYAMVRVVSDDASADLPPIEDAIAPDGSLRPLRLAGAFVRDPAAAARFIRDVQRALAALRATAAALTVSA